MADQAIAFFLACRKLDLNLREMYNGKHLGQWLNLNVRFDWPNIEICITLLHKMLEMVDT